MVKVLIDLGVDNMFFKDIWFKILSFILGQLLL